MPATGRTIGGSPLLTVFLLLLLSAMLLLLLLLSWTVSFFILLGFVVWVISLLNWTVWATVKSLSIAMRSPVCQFHKARISVWFGCLVECVCVRVFCASFGLRDWYETAKLSL